MEQNYIQIQTDKINTILLEHGAGLYDPALNQIRTIIAETIIMAVLDSTLAEQAVEWTTTQRGS